MSFITTDNADKFSYNDCILKKGAFENGGLSLEVEALIVRANNEMNQNGTDSYAGETYITFDDAEPEKLILEGYESYDADGNLRGAVADADISLNNMDTIGLFKNSYLTGIRRTEDGKYAVEIEIPDEDPSAITDVYELTLKASRVVFSWDRYMNRVQY